MEGTNFRQLKEEELAVVVPKLQVLARSSPSDKFILGSSTLVISHQLGA